MPGAASDPQRDATGERGRLAGDGEPSDVPGPLALWKFSQDLIEKSGYERAGFADTYDRFRPRTPPALLDLLCR